MTSTPKPKPPTTKLVAIQPAARESVPTVKMPYVRKEHLMDHPFRNIKTQIRTSNGK
jgi:hypothetical protein